MNFRFYIKIITFSTSLDMIQAHMLTNSVHFQNEGCHHNNQKDDHH